MSTATCPHCGTQFEDRAHLVYGGFFRRLLRGPVHYAVDAKLDDAARVRCPSCRQEFVSEAFKHFGVLSRRRYRSLIEIYVLLFLALVGYLLYRSVVEL